MLLAKETVDLYYTINAVIERLEVLDDGRNEIVANVLDALLGVANKLRENIEVTGNDADLYYEGIGDTSDEDY